MAVPTLYEQIRAGSFPRPRKLTKAAVAWLEAEVEDWIATRPATDPMASRRGRPPKG